LDVDFDVAEAAYFASEVVVNPECTLTSSSMLRLWLCGLNESFIQVQVNN
jgi:hypothetical protein